MFYSWDLVLALARIFDIRTHTRARTLAHMSEGGCEPSVCVCVYTHFLYAYITRRVRACVRSFVCVETER